MAVESELLAQLRARRDLDETFPTENLPDELKKALSERHSECRVA